LKRRTTKIRARRSAGVLSGVLSFPAFGMVGASGFLIFMAGVFIFWSSMQPQTFSNMRVGLSDAAAPVVDVVAAPVQKAAVFVRDVSGLAALQAENARLVQENEKLRAWYHTALTLEAENKSLRDLMNVQIEPRHTYITARILTDGQSNFAKSLLLAAGSENGVKKGQAVLSGDGLIGRVVEAGEKTSRVLLLNDINSRIPVIIDNSRQHAVFAGQNTDMGVLVHLPLESKVDNGVRVVTSGVGGVFPPGIPVGVVKTNGAEVLVKPNADLNRLMHVRIINIPEDPNLREGALLQSQ